MSLEILATMVVIGIALVIGAVAFGGLSRAAHIDSEDQIRARLVEDFPEVVLRDGVITADRRAAFFLCGDGRVAMANALGSKFVTRLIDSTSVRHLAMGGRREATLELDDFTFPRIRLGFACGEDLRRLARWLAREDHA